VWHSNPDVAALSGCGHRSHRADGVICEVSSCIVVGHRAPKRTQQLVCRRVPRHDTVLPQRHLWNLADRRSGAATAARRVFVIRIRVLAADRERPRAYPRRPKIRAGARSQARINTVDFLGRRISRERLVHVGAT
jgi:hypothetical protein